MSLESFNFIDSLNASNPTTTDNVSEGDDHIRGIKSTLKTTFPNINGAVNATDEEINLLDGVTATTAELNILDGITSTTAELNYTDGVTSNIQTQLGTKLPLAGGTMTGDVSLGDNVKAKFGASSDLQIYHDGSHSYITENSTGNLNIEGINIVLKRPGGSIEKYVECNVNDSVDLYYDNALKLATTSTGIDVTGSVTCDGFTSTGIDDNATSNKLTVADTGITARGGAHGLGNNLEATNGASGAFSIADPDAKPIVSYLRVGSDTHSAASVAELQLGSYGSNENAGGGSVRFYNTRWAHSVALVKGSRYGANQGKLDFYVESGGLQKQLTIDPDGLKFNGDTATANALDDYETGTWTPQITDLTNDATVNIANTGGSYTKIGNIVTVTGRVMSASVSALSGNISIKGIPFPAVTGQKGYGSLSISQAFNLNITAGRSVSGTFSPGLSTIALRYDDHAAGNTAMQATEWSDDGYVMFSGVYTTA